MMQTGEGGTGKSRVIQSVTQYFEKHNIPTMQAKGVYTGIAASLFGGKTLHILFGFTPHHGGMPSAQKIWQLAQYWGTKEYLIIDEFLMVSHTFLARMSTVLGLIWHHNHPEEATSRPFGGVNVIICGDFHQFKPVVQKKSVPLYWPINSQIDNEEEAMGSELYV